MVNGYYSATLVYATLYVNRDLVGRYGEEVMSLRVIEFQTYASISFESKYVQAFHA